MNKMVVSRERGGEEGFSGGCSRARDSNDGRGNAR